MNNETINFCSADSCTFQICHIIPNHQTPTLIKLLDVPQYKTQLQRNYTTFEKHIQFKMLLSNFSLNLSKTKRITR